MDLSRMPVGVRLSSGSAVSNLRFSHWKAAAPAGGPNADEGDKEDTSDLEGEEQPKQPFQNILPQKEGQTAQHNEQLQYFTIFARNASTKALLGALQALMNFVGGPQHCSL